MISPRIIKKQHFEIGPCEAFHKCVRTESEPRGSVNEEGD